MRHQPRISARGHSARHHPPDCRDGQHPQCHHAAEHACRPRTADSLPDYAACAPQRRDAFVPIPQADAAKYQPEDKCYTKILVNGQEPDTRGVRSVNENGRVWGAVLCILERLQTVIPDAFRYDWNAAGGCLTLHSGGHTVTAQVGVTHLLVDGKENLMDGQPYLTAEGALVMEVNALIPHITGTRTQYDDKVNVLRIETE